MPYITSFERIGMEKGIEKGFQHGRASLILKQIIRRFGLLAPENHDRILLLPAAQLEDLGIAFLDFEKIDDVAAWLDAYTTSA